VQGGSGKLSCVSEGARRLQPAFVPWVRWEAAASYMQVLFVHGMGRSPISGWSMLRRLRRAGLTTASFGYGVSIEDFAAIRERLVRRITGLSAQGDYVLVGHSLGGVLLRAALHALPCTVPAPRHLYLLGSPMRASRLAQGLQGHLLYRGMTGDCGQLLASPERMAGIGPVAVDTTHIVGTRGIAVTGHRFGDEPNDGVVALSEVSADWVGTQICVTVPHTWLPSSRQVSDILLRSLHDRAQLLRGMVDSS
jgi:pimeloyl-ACP methyl ester carboxylesterase